MRSTESKLHGLRALSVHSEPGKRGGTLALHSCPTRAQRKIGKSHASVWLMPQQSRDSIMHQASRLFSLPLCVAWRGVPHFGVTGMHWQKSWAVSHARRWALVKFLWGLCRQRQLCSTFCHPLLSVLSVCLPFFSLLLSGFARGASLLQLQHSLDACLLLPRGSLASPGHTVKTIPQEENRNPVRSFPSRCLWCEAVNGSPSPLLRRRRRRAFRWLSTAVCVFQTEAALVGHSVYRQWGQLPFIQSKRLWRQ